jgi:hypothetical protein
MPYAGLVKRNFKQSPYFRNPLRHEKIPFELGAQEAVVGVYENPAPYEGVNTYFCDERFVVVEHGAVARAMRYVDVKRYQPLTATDNKEGNGLRVASVDKILFLRFSGQKRGVSMDLFSAQSVMRMLHLKKIVDRNGTDWEWCSICQKATSEAWCQDNKCPALNPTGSNFSVG